MLRTLRRDEDGAAMVEAAVVMPVLFLLLFGAFEFSKLYLDRHAVQTAVRDAARFLARVDDPAAAAEQARRLAVFGTADGSGTRRVSWWNPGALTVTTGDCEGFCAVVTSIPNPIDSVTGERTWRGGDSIRTIEVRADLTYPGLGALDLVGLGTPRFRVSHAERAIGE